MVCDHWLNAVERLIVNMNLILLGAPGAGKGTQAEVICENWNIPVISIGNILREAIKAETALGVSAKVCLDNGELVPNEVVTPIVKQRIQHEDCQRGFILDGYPRTLAQAKALDQMDIVIDKVLMIEVSDADIIQRLCGRRVCEACGAVYHIRYKPSQVEQVCDKCGGATVIRTDDDADTVRDRLTIYHQETAPLKDYYEQQGKLQVIVGQELVADTTALTLQAVQRLLAQAIDEKAAASG